MEMDTGKKQKTLRDLRPGQKGIILALNSQGPLKRRLVDMGVTPGTEIFVRKVAPLGDPIEVNLRGYELSLRGDDARNILIEKQHTDR
jgi:Fe2+ transport system protein FeoA